jgi:hypothetical protein
LEQGGAIKVEMPAQQLGISEDFGRFRIFLSGDVTRFFQQRKVDIGFNITGRARIAVPIPCAAKVPRLVNHAEVVDAGHPQARRGQKAAKTRPDDGNVRFFNDRIPGETGLYIRIGVMIPKNFARFDILVHAIGPKPLFAFDPIPLLEFGGRERSGV